MKKSVLSAIVLLSAVIVFGASDPMKATSAKALNLQEVASTIEYPTATNEGGIEGTVMMEIEIDAQGNVSEKTALSYPCTRLKEVVEAAVADLKFEPARDAFGDAMASTLKIPFQFELKID
ncbi:MAG: TonB family protein [Marinoscillum sp.]